jgi:hypothetical protein
MEDPEIIQLAYGFDELRESFRFLCGVVCPERAEYFVVLGDNQSADEVTREHRLRARQSHVAELEDASVLGYRG